MNGEPAFPIGGPDDFLPSERGMPGLTIRDYFAGQVLMGIQSSGLATTIYKQMLGLTRSKKTEQAKATAKVIAKISYWQADAMLADRLKESTATRPAPGEAGQDEATPAL